MHLAELDGGQRRSIVNEGVPVLCYLENERGLSEKSFKYFPNELSFLPMQLALKVYMYGAGIQSLNSENICETPEMLLKQDYLKEIMQIRH